jgi:hypothetical protein
MITKNRIKNLEKELKRQQNDGFYTCFKVFNQEIYYFEGATYYDFNDIKKQLPEDASLVILASWIEEKI